jgi:hypothetical protein
MIQILKKYESMDMLGPHDTFTSKVSYVPGGTVLSYFLGIMCTHFRSNDSVAFYNEALPP